MNVSITVHSLIASVARSYRVLVVGIGSGLTRCLIGLIRVYQLLLSPWLGPCCRFTPTCSAYGVVALRRFGVWRGAWLTVRRIARCHPWHAGGHDPVPDVRTGFPQRGTHGFHNHLYVCDDMPGATTAAERTP